MTPKEKAEQLVGKFIDYVNCWDNDGANYTQAYNYTKQCALICVDEIYNLRLTYGQYLEYDEDKINYHSYWEQVKQEIEKL